MNNTFNLGHAAAVDADGFVYLLGSFGENGQTAMLARVSVADFKAFTWASIAYWAGAGAWEPLGPALDPIALFGFVPSETTLFFHAALSAWYVVVANTFISSSISIRTAPALTGPWSDMQDVYAIPPEMLAGGTFCYAGKAHPELSPLNATPPEFVFSFMCNTPTIQELENRTDIYVPQLIRTRIAASAGADDREP